jgi:hypothetical protein
MKRQNRRSHNFTIIKASGRPEPFSKQKLYQSIEHTCLPPKTCQEITDRVAEEVEEGFKTRDIYRKALGFLKENSHLAAVQYSLKMALFDLGPSGHNFEYFVAKYFAEKGFQTKTCQLVQGQLVKHEIDVIGLKSGKKIYVECKFHNRVGIKNDIKIALYVKARWDDLKDGPDGKNLNAFYLVSNTSFSVDAMTYAEGSGLHLLGVNAPKGNSFLDDIIAMRLYPITSLRRINRSLKNKLIGQGFILAKDLQIKKNLLLQQGMTEHEVSDLMSELDLLINEEK